MQVAFFCCFRQGVAGMSRDLGRDVPDLEKLYARKLWADFSYIQGTEKYLPPPPRQQQKKIFRVNSGSISTPTVDMEMLEKLAKPYLP